MRYQFVHRNSPKAGNGGAALRGAMTRLESLMCRLKGDMSVELNRRVLPAKSHAGVIDAGAAFRLIWADFGWLRDNEALRCP